MAYGLVASLLLDLSAPCLAHPLAGPDIPELPELNWEKRSDWIDVTRDVISAAVGDGVADDTARQRFFKSEAAIPTNVFDAKRDFGAKGDGRTVDNYRGRLSSVMGQYFNPTEGYDPHKKAFKVVCIGEAPLDVLLMANAYQQKGNSPPRPSTTSASWANSTWNSSTPKNRRAEHAEQPIHERE
jgi:hypothetical protein